MRLQVNVYNIFNNIDIKWHKLSETTKYILNDLYIVPHNKILNKILIDYSNTKYDTKYNLNVFK